jgi:hypothetical protein
MALLRWMHLRKLVPLEDLLDQLGGSPRTAAPTRAASIAPTSEARIAPTAKGSIAPTTERSIAPTSQAGIAPTAKESVAPASAAAAATVGKPTAKESVAPTSSLKDSLLAEIRAGKSTLYSLAIAQAQRIDVRDDSVTFTFAPNQNVARMQLEQNRAWIEAAAQRIAGRRIAVVIAQSDAAAPAPAQGTIPEQPKADEGGGKRDLKSEAMASPAVQAVLEVFPAEIRDIEEM